MGWYTKIWMFELGVWLCEMFVKSPLPCRQHDTSQALATTIISLQPTSIVAGPGPSEVPCTLPAWILNLALWSVVALKFVLYRITLFQNKHSISNRFYCCFSFVIAMVHRIPWRWNSSGRRFFSATEIQWLINWISFALSTRIHKFRKMYRKFFHI